MIKSFALILLVLHSLPAEDCRTCHQSHLSACGLTCNACHNVTKAVFPVDILSTKNHPPVLRFPSANDYSGEKCQKCHQRQVESYRQSGHFTMENMLKTLSVSSIPGLPQKLSRKNLINLQPVKSPAGANEIIGPLLVQKCLRCHTEARVSDQASGRKRHNGCASCHIAVDQKSGASENGHKFSGQVADATCLTCHSGNYTGADYYGYYEHDYHQDYNTPVGSSPEFGSFQHRLSSDIHQKKGLSCTDCHSFHKAYSSGRKVKECLDCHTGNPAKAVSETAAYNPDIVPHQSFHKQVSCTSCHAGWSYQDYGLHLYYDQTKQYDFWINYKWQGDQWVTDWLDSMSVLPEAERKMARSPNYLSGALWPGIWYTAWEFRRWEDPVLGIGADGRYKIIQPFSGMNLTYVDSLNRVWLDSEKFAGSWRSYSPHTIQPAGRACESCHGNAKAAGLGIRQSPEDIVSNPVTIPQFDKKSADRALNSAEQKRLLIPSALYRSKKAEYLQSRNIMNLFR